MSASPGVAARLAALTARYSLPDGAIGQLGTLLQTLAADEHAPTTVRDPAAAAGVHIADSLAGLELDVVREARTIADLGAGAGFPGLALAAALPAAHVALVESSARKCAFIVGAASAASIANVEVVAARAEDWPEGIGRHDLVTARALAPLGVLAEYAAPLLREGGALAAWKGRRDEREEADGAAAAEQTGLVAAEIRPVEPWDSARHRHLHLYVKVGSTPNRFPRRPGIASKKPLQAST
jgi:16S rRNA (guanine527-N7)-methyltransferase